MNNRRCKHFWRESWCYKNHFEEGIITGMRCDIGCPLEFHSLCDFDNCPMYSPVTLDEYYKDIYNILNNSLKYTFGHYTFKTTSQEYTKYFTKI